MIKQIQQIPKWQTYQQVKVAFATNKLSQWLTYSGSFMQRLEEHGVKDAEIVVLSQEWQYPYWEEKKLLQIPSRSYVWVREVLILSANKKWMFARSVFPRTSLTGRHRKFSQLKNRSLGSVIFKAQSMFRSEFEFNLVGGDIARRSVFTVENKKFLLTEVFLEDMHAL